jgi:superfamily II DNA or RNA helicase
MARSTKSLGLYIQMIMRGMTQNDTYDDCIILDHSDNIARLGWPDDFVVTELCHGKKGENKDRVNSDEPLPKKCGQCGYMKPPKTPLCPNCQHEAEPQAGIIQEEGDLLELKKEVTPTQLKHIKESTPESQQAFYSGLVGYAKSKQYKDSYADYKFKDRYGVWPENFEKVSGDFSTGEIAGFIRYMNIKNSFACKRNYR